MGRYKVDPITGELTLMNPSMSDIPIYQGVSGSTASVSGLVPQAQAGDEEKALLGNGTWGSVSGGETISYADWLQLTPEEQTHGEYFIPDYSGSILPTGGFDNVPTAGSQNPVTSNGIYEVTKPFTGAQGSIAGIGGTVPAPSAGDEDKVLKGDGTWSNIIDFIYPINSVYISMINTNPSTYWAGTTWELLSDGYLRNNATDATGGSSTSGSTTLTAEQIPSHSHTITTGSYGDHTHTATTQNTGAHTHTATTGSYGAHQHTAISRSGGTKASLGWIVIGGQDDISGTEGFAHNSTGYWNEQKVSTYPYTSSGGAHTHTLTTNSYGKHTHTLTTQSTGAHTHTGATQAIGGGKGHTHSIEPSYVRIYAFKRTA